MHYVFTHSPAARAKIRRHTFHVDLAFNLEVHQRFTSQGVLICYTAAATCECVYVILSQAFVRDMNPEGSSFPQTLGELSEQLKAWRGKLQVGLIGQVQVHSNVKIAFHPPTCLMTYFLIFWLLSLRFCCCASVGELLRIDIP